MQTVKRFLYSPHALLFSSAVTTALTLTVGGAFGLLEWISLLPLFFALSGMAEERASLPRAYGFGLFFFFCYYLVLYHWFLYLYPMEFAGLDPLSAAGVVAAGWLGLSFLQALGGALLFPLWLWLCRRGVFTRAPWSSPLLLGAAWAVFEWTQTLGWFGVPWGRLCLGQTDLLPFIQSASLFGCYFVSFLLVAVNGWIAAALRGTKDRGVCALLAAVFFVFNLGFGTLRLALWKEKGNAYRVGIVQADIPSSDKWTVSVDETFVRYADLTDEAIAEGATVILWSETAFPYQITEDSYGGKKVCEYAREQGVTIFFGGLSLRGDRLYNTLFEACPDGTLSEIRYDKRHLVPFGEYVPMRDFFEAVMPALTEIILAGHVFEPGTDPTVFPLDGEACAGALLCFDSIYETLARDSVREGAGLLLLPTNDSWFSDSAALSMHNAQARLRAVENARPIVRCANTGISTVIDARGRVGASLPPLVPGYIVADVYPRTERTLWTAVGNLFVALSAAGVAAGAVFALVNGRIMVKNKEK